MKNWTAKDLEKNLKKGRGKTLFPTNEFLSDDNVRINLEIYNTLLTNQSKVIFIPGNVPSLKNSKRILTIPTGKTECCNSSYTKLKSYSYKCNSCGQVSSVLKKRPFIKPSLLHDKYFENVYSLFVNNMPKFLELTKDLKLPYNVGFYFIRNSQRSWDWDNAITTIMDILNKSNLIAEDNINIIKPIPLGWHYDKNNSGVIITLLKSVEVKYLWD